jgi:hypothetical protein
VLQEIKIVSNVRNIPMLDARKHVHNMGTHGNVSSRDTGVKSQRKRLQC